MIPTATATVDAHEYMRRYRTCWNIGTGCEACPHYGAYWTCPPFETDPYVVAMAAMPYARITLVALTVPCVQSDMKAVENARSMLEAWLLEKEKHGAMAFGCGGCRRCITCTRKSGKACRHPEAARPSLEACGFDVQATAKDLLGIELQWGDAAGTTTVVGAFMTGNSE